MPDLLPPFLWSLYLSHKGRRDVWPQDSEPTKTPSGVQSNLSENQSLRSWRTDNGFQMLAWGVCASTWESLALGPLQRMPAPPVPCPASGHLSSARNLERVLHLCPSPPPRNLHSTCCRVIWNPESLNNKPDAVNSQD